MQKIVVGTDGSDNAGVAVRWAADEAAVHGAALEVVLAWGPFNQSHADRSDRVDDGYDEDDARSALAAWVAEDLGPDADVGQRVVRDGAIRALVVAGDSADLLVLGARGKGGFEGLLLGSVSDRVVQFADRPVAVVRTAAPVRHGRIVVGVDGSARSLEALQWAAAEARARDAELDVVHAWQLPMMTSPPVHVLVQDYNLLEGSSRAILDNALSHPALSGVKTNPLFTYDSPARALLGRADGAGLLVVGARGLGRVAGTLLGSVSRQLLHHAPCPVVVT